MNRSGPAPDLRHAIEVALREADAFDRLEVELRAALEQGDDASALAIARRLVGLPPDVRAVS